MPRRTPERRCELILQRRNTARSSVDGGPRRAAEIGAEHDLVDPRAESYVKDFKPLRLGEIQLEKGVGQLVLRALEVPGDAVMDFRLLMLNRVE